MSERIVISPPERKILESRARARSGSVAEAMRSKIVLSLAAGNSQAHTSRTVGCGVNTVRLWKERFVKERFGGLYGRHRGRSRSKESVRLEARVLRLANTNRLMDRRTGRLVRLPPPLALTTSG